MLKFYFNGAPNPTKVALFLEEAGLPYEADPGRHPQGRAVQAGLSRDQSERQGAGHRRRRRHRVRQQCHPALPRREDRQVSAGEGRQGARRAVVLADVRGFRRRPLFRPGRAFPHFRAGQNDYAINRYAFEAQRHFGILDARLAKQQYMLGDTYTIVDMACGAGRAPCRLLGEAAWAKFPNLKRLVDEISARPAAQRAVALKDKHTFKAEMDDEARKAMFPHLREKVA